MTQYSDEINCFDKLRLLKNAKCNIENCPRRCTSITKGNPNDKFWCRYHIKKAIKEGRVIKGPYDISLYPIAKLLVWLGIVKL